MKKSENREVFMGGLHELSSAIAASCAEMGLSDVHAKVLTRTVQSTLVDTWGGLQIHIPSRHMLEIEARDNAIRASHRAGYGTAELAGRHGLAIRHVQRIIRNSDPRRPRKP